VSPECCKALTDGSNGRATPVVERKASLEEREGQARVEDEEGRDVEGRQAPRDEEEEEQDKGVEDQAPIDTSSSSAAADAAPQVSALLYGISHECIPLRPIPPSPYRGVHGVLVDRAFDRWWPPPRLSCLRWASRHCSPPCCRCSP
jgi:hypothetical protein